MIIDGMIAYIAANKTETLVSIVVNLFSDFISVKISDKKNRKKVCKLKTELCKWAYSFQKKYEGSILTKGVYIQYLEYQRIIERLYQYVLSPQEQVLREEDYITSLVENCKVMLNSEETVVQPMDESILKAFYTELLEKVKHFLQTTGGMELKEILYTMNQILLGNRDALEALQSKYVLDQKRYRSVEQRLEEVRKILQEQGPHIDDEWFLNQNRQAILNMGKRYLPDLNVTLDIQKDFDIVEANQNFFRNLCEEADELLICLHEISGEDSFLSEKRDVIVELLNGVREFRDFEKVRIQLAENAESCSKYAADEYKRRVKEKQKNDNWGQSVINRYREIWVKADRYADYLRQNKMNLVNTPILILYGEGGIGKSHLVADTVVKRNENSERSILLLGQDFPKGCIIWSRFTELLECSQPIDVVLQAVSRIAEEKKSRILIFIDAINEGGGKEVWHDRLASVAEKIMKYPWLGLILTIRKDFLRTIVDPEVVEKYHITQIEHRGFGRLTEEAIQKYFAYYGIELTVMPYFPEEFSNPLFLRLFCEGYEKKPKEQIVIDTEQIYANYIDEMNHRLAEKFRYTSSINVVRMVITELALASYDTYQRNRLDKEKAVGIVSSIAGRYQISTCIFDALISEGILANGIDSNEKEYVYVTYERLADHIYASHMLEEVVEKKSPEEELLEKVNKPGVLEEMACLLPRCGMELFGRFPSIKEEWQTAEAFTASIIWRTDDGLKKEETYEYINDQIVVYEGLFEEFYENLIRVSTNEKHPYNGEMLHEQLSRMTMAERDAEFMELFNSWNTDGTSAYRLMDWCYQTVWSRRGTKEETIYLAALTLSWMLICTDNLFRDKISMALCHLLRGHTEVMIRILQAFRGVDDRYITERLYAIAFGVVTFEQDEENIRKLSRYVYETVFTAEEVIPDILIRDSAKRIILYALSIQKDDSIDLKKVCGPYHSTFPEVPSDDVLEKYELDYKAEEFKDYQWAQNIILSSMRIDDHTGGYGDFGRYVFQSYFHGWKDVDANDLMKIAVADIFDRGYDVELHGVYDRRLRDYSRIAERKTERIGKKYQWQALYQLAAQVSDHYKRENPACGIKEYNTGAYEPRLRDFDPTINIKRTSADFGKFPAIPYHNFDYPEQQWVTIQDDLPDFSDMVRLELKKDSFLLLSGMHSWKEKAPIGMEEYDCPLKEMWFMIQAYFVKEEDYLTSISVLQEENFWGRWMPEASDNYTMYNREYYWSDTHAYYDNEYFGGCEWKKPWNTENVILQEMEFLVPDYTYVATAEKEIPELRYSRWKKPCKTLFQTLDLLYQEENTVLYDKTGKVMCFDTCEVFDEDCGFYFQETALKAFLEEKHYKMFWTVLGEKRVIGGSFLDEKIRLETPEYTGLFYFDENGEIAGRIRSA